MKKDELNELIEKLQYIYAEMEERDIDEINLSCNTYGKYGVNVSIPGKGYAYLDTIIEDIESGEYDE